MRYITKEFDKLQDKVKKTNEKRHQCIKSLAEDLLVKFDHGWDILEWNDQKEEYDLLLVGVHYCPYCGTHLPFKEERK